MDAPRSVRCGASVLALERVVVEQLLDEVDVAHEHAAAAVAGEVQRVEGVALGVIRLEEVQVGIPLVSDDLREPGGGIGSVGGAWRGIPKKWRGASARGGEIEGGGGRAPCRT